MAGLVNFTPHLGQQLTFDSKARFIADITGLQGGKTTGGAIWLLNEIYLSWARGERGNWLIAAPTVKILQQSTLPKFKEFFPSDWGVWREQKQCFELSWGDYIFVRSTDEPDHLEGMTVRGAWIDEAGQIDGDAWINIQGRLAIFQGRALFTTTPYTVGWLHREIEKKAARVTIIDDQQNVEVVENPAGESYIEVFRWASVSNPAFPREEYDRAKKMLSKEIFDRRYRGLWTRLEGLVYKEFAYHRHVVKAFPVPGEWKKRFAGLDFGSNHPTAVLCIVEKPEIPEDKEKRIAFEPSKFYVFAEFYKSDSLLKDVAQFLKAHILKYVLGDPSARQQLAELRRYWGVSGVMEAENNVEIGIERVQTLLLQDRLFFMEERCPHTLEEIQEYHRPKLDPDKPSSEKPVKIKDDAMDALKYAFSKDIKGMYAEASARYEKAKKFVHGGNSQLDDEPRQSSNADDYTGY